MEHTLPRLVWVASLALASGCVGGWVYDVDTGTGVDGVTVVAKTCPTCPPKTTVSATESPDGIREPFAGVFMYDTYAGDEPALPEGDALATEFTLSKPGYATTRMYFRPQLRLYEHGSGEQRVGAYTIAPLSKGPDTDGDGLSSAYEASAQLDPNDMDTDDDGVSDGWEVLGSDYVDYRFYGANPRRKDIFVEIDYESYYENGVEHSAYLRPAVIDKITEWFGKLNVSNPDGSKGVSIHILQDEKLPKNYNCSYSDNSKKNARLDRVFHYGQICLQKVACQGGGGTASLTQFRAGYFEVDADSNNDLDEEAQFLWAMIVAHEIGHTYGLHHGGQDYILCKPNYPSLMNYAYAHYFKGMPRTLRQTQLQFSPGRFIGYPLNEAGVSELNAFAGVPRSELEFLRYFGYPANAHGFKLDQTQPYVDWNRNTTFQSGQVATNISGRGYVTQCGGNTDYCADSGTPQVLNDYNDGALIAGYLASHPTWTSSLTADKPAPATTCAF